MALESEDMKQISDAIKTTLSNCILQEVSKINELSTFDIEYLFLNIRAKSVGETVEVNVTCPDDGETQVPVKLILTEIVFKRTKVIKILSS